MSTDATSAATARYVAVTFDCPDPIALARFYSSALGLPITYSSDEFALLGEEGVPGLGFSRLAGYTPPTWPDPSQEKQAHLDLAVDDLDAAQTRLLALGATEPPTQPQPDRWRVLLDPAGHPFCITTGV
ncbi:MULTISPECIES: VOC family protein [Salinispora]|uniref:VOC family protein n=1 Tax=Salinispora TaxID=168694 RepID=UPI00036428BE|nr:MULTISPECIES: VOC family protein [Salinispora]